MQFGKNLKAIRTQQGLTLTELAGACGLSKGFISQLEAGHSAPSLATLSKLADALHTTPALLITYATGRREESVQEPRAYRNGELRSNVAKLSLIERAGDTSYFLASLDYGARVVAHAARQMAATKAIATLRRGSVRLRQAGTDLRLSDGDMATWDASTAYVIENSGPNSAELLICLPSSAEPLELQVTGQERRPVAPTSSEGPFRLIAMRAERRLALGS